MSTVTREVVNTAEAVADYTSNYRRKILVGGFDVECIRWNKIVHIEFVRRLPKIHEDGRVTVRAFNHDYEVKAEKVTLNSTGQSWFSFSITV